MAAQQEGYTSGESSRKDKESDKHQMQCHKPRNNHEPFVLFVLFIESRLLAYDLKQHKQHSVIQAIENVISCKSVPAAHDEHVYHERYGSYRQLIFDLTAPYKIHRYP